MQLLRLANGVVVQQAVYAAAKLGIADLLNDGPKTAKELANQLRVNESALYRILRLLSSQGIFQELAQSTFSNSDLSEFLRTGVPGSVRPLFVFRGSEFCFAPFGEILYTIETGIPAREKLYGMNAFEHFKGNPEMARIFDDAMTNFSQLTGPSIAGAYDFGRWDSLMDVGGGNGLLLSTILKAHPSLRGVLADLPHVLDRARERGFLGGELESRTSLESCDMFREVPSGCRAYLMKSVIHDWDDERANDILAACRRAVPGNGALLLVELLLPEGNQPSFGKFSDVLMLMLTGGKERSIEQYRKLLAGAGFHLNQVYPVPGDFCVIESFPA